ncbi:RNA polymerase II transcriptional coactivator-like [Harmonia axyridis]|uniref:RNA polymerase II transcriptional coactivator-like n=1 Tax=Harmonia axyridis TaxID=115357 RepID=UPI001E27858E|nr:RNA polymerase II transcriptional coactivator-like [Harmonia axyridis]XP_045473571.1 RNA polymerase II transcriptional coactivator-like [Harmonia axyridis]
MPKRTKKADSSDSDSGQEDRGPVKKQKITPEEENSWYLGNKRFVKLSEYKSKWYVNIREFYEANGELKPGRRGMMLTMEQWQKLKGIVGEVDEAIKKNV